jgi:hypothetical protein
MMRWRDFNAVGRASHGDPEFFAAQTMVMLSNETATTHTFDLIFVKMTEKKDNMSP